MTQNSKVPLLPQDSKGVESLGTEVEKMPKRVEVDNMEQIDGAILEELQCGDIVVKKTKEGKKDLFHTYIVSHKQATGICISYNTTGYSDTYSYDKIEGVWTFNSKDVWQAQE